MNFEGEPVVAYGTSEKGVKQTFSYKNKSWNKLSQTNSLQSYKPLFINKMGNKLYLMSNPDNKKAALSIFNLETNSISRIFYNDKADIFDLIRDPDSLDVVAVKTQPGFTETYFLDKDNQYAKYYQQLGNVFKHSDINITSQTRDGKELIVKVVNDKNSGSFYIFSPEKKKLIFLLNSRDWLKPKWLAYRKPINILTRDNFKIHGYLTLPLDNNKNIPLVVLVHGGPYGIRDNWQLDFTNIEAQMLANNGYAVLQVNYRGSGGYGKNYEELAYQKRSTLIQYDIIDATKIVLSLPEISDTNVCIMGWSFGGYSALMAPLIESELFKCAIPASDVYDAVDQEKKADYSKVKSVRKEAESVYGSDENLLKKESPCTGQV